MDFMQFMALITCELDNIQKIANCADRGGYRKLYWFRPSEVDWATMLADPLLFDPATHTILDYAMIGGAVFTEVEFEPKSSFYDFTFTKETDVYSLLVSWIHKGKDPVRRLALQKAINCCDIGVHIYANDGSQRVIAQDYNGETMVDLLDPLAVGRHLDSSGQLGSSRSRDEIDLTGEAFYAPLFATVAEADLPLV